jgi:predicted Ser/Thr protein kinase
VLGRLERPDPARYPEPARALVEGLTPAEKMALDEDGSPPERLGLDERRTLRALLPDLYRESEADPAYEGIRGPSPREIASVLMNAAQSDERPCLDVPAVLEELEALLEQRSVYAFLQETPEEGYRDHAAFVQVVREMWLDAVDDEVREALGLVAESQYRASFERYVVQVSAWVTGERLRNEVTGELEPPDERWMREMEAILAAPDEDRDAFRKGLIARVGAWRLAHPVEEGEGSGLDYPEIFPDLYRRLKEHHHSERRSQLLKVHDHLLTYLDEEARGSLAPRERETIERLLGGLTRDHGYCDRCAQSAVLALMRARYAA